MTDDGGIDHWADPDPSGEERDPQSRVGAAMKAAREARNISRRELARRLQMSHSNLADYEHGHRLAPADIVTAYERSFGLPPGSLCAIWEQARSEMFGATRDRRRPFVPPEREGIRDSGELALPARGSGQRADPDVPSSSRAVRTRLDWSTLRNSWVVRVTVGVVVLVGATLVVSVVLWPRYPGGHRKQRMKAPAKAIAPLEESPLGGQLIPGDNSTFRRDVTIPDGSRLHVDQEFVKTWEMQNIGTVTWDGRYLQREGPLEGPGLCQSPARVPIPRTEPNQTVQISVPFRAPHLGGSCYTEWKVVDERGRYFFPDFGPLFMTVEIVS